MALTLVIEELEDARTAPRRASPAPADNRAAENDTIHALRGEAAHGAGSDTALPPVQRNEATEREILQNTIMSDEKKR